MFDISKSIDELLIDLIAVKSESLEEREICDRLEATLQHCSGRFTSKITRVKNSLLFELDLKRDKRIGLVGHIDTVPVAASSTVATVKDGEIWGRGACDMKAGVAVILKILYEISTGRITPNYNISMIFYENEEGALPNGINFLLDMGLLTNIDFAYILEPTEARYSLGCLGSLTVEKVVEGTSAHSANPRKGDSALTKALSIVNRVDELNQIISSDRELDGLKYYETVNVTTLKTTNTTFNVIPAKVEMIANYRFSPEKSLEDALELLKEYYGEDGLTILDNADSCYIGTKGDDFLLDGIEREIMQAWTDIAQLNSVGIPAINYGPGSIKFAHKPDERITIAELNEFYTKMIEHL